uniref:CST complex subunit STN1 n=1 Tax=Ananas comosus var. bracteatus TaxID=296719 RepID=A0A6V7PSK2_ANACO|nr:unnamed protein product [Ananas comosus var. bracteatus]
MDPVHRVHVKLLACDLLSLVPSSSSSSLLRPRPRPRPPLPISRAETLGVVVLRERRPLLLSFLVDDGSGCVPCVLWLNHLHRRHFSASTSAAPPLDVVLAAEAAAERADAVRLGALVRVRGRVGFIEGRCRSRSRTWSWRGIPTRRCSTGWIVSGWPGTTTTSHSVVVVSSAVLVVFFFFFRLVCCARKMFGEMHEWS